MIFNNVCAHDIKFNKFKFTFHAQFARYVASLISPTKPVFLRYFFGIYSLGVRLKSEISPIEVRRNIGETSELIRTKFGEGRTKKRERCSEFCIFFAIRVL